MTECADFMNINASIYDGGFNDQVQKAQHDAYLAWQGEVIDECVRILSGQTPVNGI